MISVVNVDQAYPFNRLLKVRFVFASIVPATNAKTPVIITSIDKGSFVINLFIFFIMLGPPSTVCRVTYFRHFRAFVTLITIIIYIRKNELIGAIIGESPILFYGIKPRLLRLNNCVAYVR